MKIVKTCAYRTTCYNLIPSMLLTPLYSVVNGWPSFTAADMFRTRVLMSPTHGVVQVPRVAEHWDRSGFRLAFKFACFHYGIEVRYEHN